MGSLVLFKINKFYNERHLTKVEVDFYAQWVEDLNALKYKWPKIKRNLSAKKNEKKIQLIYKAIEQKQSSNSNENQPSLKMLKSKSSSLCPLIDQDKSHGTIKDIVLITKIDDQNEANNFFKLLKRETFENCVQNSFAIGFRQQSFLIFKDSSHILPSLDLDSFQFQQANSIQDSDLDNFFFFVRKNVANGVRKSKIVSKKLELEEKCRLLNGSFINSALFKAIESLRWHSNDLAAENCQNLPARTVWIPDFHDGPRVDLSSTLVYLGQNSVLAGSKLYSSPYAAALKMSKVSSQLSPYVKKYKSVHPANLHDSDARENFDYYKKSSDFEPVDLVICSFPSAFCEAFIPLNKTIIFNPAHRYNMGKCSQPKWLKLNENYDKLHKKNKLVVSAMSRYDLEYHTHFVESKPLYRLYAYGGFYARDIHFNPIRDEILVGPSNGMGAGATNKRIHIQKNKRSLSPIRS
ncbi:hypothetical protein BpHYR1_049471 [Brachionus plicatilis]|uniref:Uncharacterized protein n=1 Tax=Brachionus plicatilis TaxID=10195 RepID=A0A3M7REI6_BRAPC|nr:hypothetical protein BpHYR1_049471 [Brachionus plicatilis]